jgi:CRP-like cAMP-binding protein
MISRATIIDRPVRHGSNIICGPWRSTQAHGGALRPGPDPDGLIINCCKAHLIFLTGDKADRSFEVVKGAVSAYAQLKDGRRQVIDFFFPGDIFGIAPAGLHTYHAEAISNLTLRTGPVTADAFATDGDRTKMRAQFASTVASLHDAHDRMLLLGRKKAEERIASFLLRMAARIGIDAEGCTELPMTGLDIADYLGLTIETVSRTFSKLRRDGLIALPGSRTVVLLRIENLSQLAGTEDDQ